MHGQLQAENKFIFADRHGLICRIKSPQKEPPKSQPIMRARTSSVTENILEIESFADSHSTDNTLSSSFENLHVFNNNEIKKTESFFYGFFNDNNNNYCGHKKTVTIMEPNGHKVYPVKPIKKDKVNDGNKKIVECHLKAGSFLDLSSSNLSLLSRSISKLNNLTELYIYGNKIAKLPKEIGNLINLKELWMQENIIDSLPIEMKNCKLLQHLDIRHNHLTDDSLLVLTSLVNLRILLITHNKFTRLDGIGRLNKLETLTVKGNKIEGSLTKSLGKLHCMVTLDLSKNKIVIIPNELGECTKLKRLNFEYNKIVELPETIGNLKELEFIGIKYNQLEKLPESLSDCGLLKELNIESNLIEEIPSVIVLKFQQMIKFNISHNKFINLPKFPNSESIKIEKFNAEYNNISRISGSVVNAQSLKVLNLCYNNLSELQSFDIQNLICLIDLNLAFNHLSDLPKDISRLTHLESLDLTNNLLTTLPKEIGMLKNLKFLNLESNILLKIPDEFCELEKLKNLNISSNQLKTFPSCIVKLKNLEMLNVSENFFSELPESINELDRLTHLFLKDNILLNSLPVTLAGMKNLNFLSLNGCPLGDIPGEYRKSPISVIAYLRALDIGLKLHEYWKMSNNKSTEKSLFSSDTSLNIANDQPSSKVSSKENRLAALKPTTPYNSSKLCEAPRPRSMSATAACSKDHVEKTLNRKSTPKITIPESLVKKMKTTEAGFLACSRKMTSKK